MFFLLTYQRVWKTVKSQGKIREKSGNFEVDDKWQPCLSYFPLSAVDEWTQVNYKTNGPLAHQFV